MGHWNFTTSTQSIYIAWAMRMAELPKSNFFFIGNVSESCYNVLFGYPLSSIKGRMTRDQMRLLLCVRDNHPYLNLFEADSFWGRSREEYINSLLEDELFTPKIQLQFSI